ncbi:hypothetical protein AAMO2058_000505100 [Amorphochlora amoebiformis]
MPFQRPIDYSSFYLLPKAVNARPGMRFGAPTTDSTSPKQTSPRGLASRLSAKAKSFVPKTSTHEQKSSAGTRDWSPTKSDSSYRSKFGSSTESTPEASPNLGAESDPAWQTDRKKYSEEPVRDSYRASEGASYSMRQMQHPKETSQDLGYTSWHQQTYYQGYGYDEI